MKFIHVSDLHFHGVQKKNQEATTVLRTIKEKYPNHGLIVTGDITDDGHSLQFQNAFEALEPFEGNVFIAPGNHDFGAKGNFYSQERALRFDEMLSIPLQQGGTFKGDSTPVVNLVEEGDDHIMLIALDTNLETDRIWDFACGEVGKDQLSVLDRIVSDPSNAEMVKLLFFHHHPFIHNHFLMELKDAQDLMRTIYCKVDILLFGHKHVLGLWEKTNGIQFVLASANSPEKDRAREISIEKKKIKVKNIAIKPGRGRKKGG